MKRMILLLALVLAACAGDRAKETATAACKHLEGTPEYGECYATVYATDLQSRRAAASALGRSITATGAGLLYAPTYQRPTTTNCRLNPYNNQMTCTSF